MLTFPTTNPIMTTLISISSVNSEVRMMSNMVSTVLNVESGSNNGVSTASSMLDTMIRLSTVVSNHGDCTT